MDAWPQRKESLTRSLVTLLCASWFVISFAPTLFAQKSVQIEIGGVSQSTRVLQTRVVQFGNKSFVFNRVEPPAVISRIARLTPVAAEGVETVVEDEPQRWVCRTFSGVMQGGISELVWWDESGNRQTIYSNVNFAHFLPWFDFRIDGVAYSAAFFGIPLVGDEIPEISDPSLREKVARLAGNRSPDYVSSGPLSADDADMLDLLHAYYAANAAELKQRAEEIALAGETARQLAEIEAAKPKTLIFNFWKSSTTGEKK